MAKNIVTQMKQRKGVASITTTLAILFFAFFGLESCSDNFEGRQISRIKVKSVQLTKKSGGAGQGGPIIIEAQVDTDKGPKNIDVSYDPATGTIRQHGSDRRFNLDFEHKAGKIYCKVRNKRGEELASARLSFLAEGPLLAEAKVEPRAEQNSPAPPDQDSQTRDTEKEDKDAKKDSDTKKEEEDKDAKEEEEDKGTERRLSINYEEFVPPAMSQANTPSGKGASMGRSSIKSGSPQNPLGADTDASGKEEKRKADEEAVRKAEEKRKADEEAVRKAEEKRKADEEAVRKAEEKRKADEEAVRKAEEKRKADEEAASENNDADVVANNPKSAPRKKTPKSGAEKGSKPEEVVKKMKGVDARFNNELPGLRIQIAAATGSHVGKQKGLKYQKDIGRYKQVSLAKEGKHYRLTNRSANIVVKLSIEKAEYNNAYEAVLVSPRTGKETRLALAQGQIAVILLGITKTQDSQRNLGTIRIIKKGKDGSEQRITVTLPTIKVGDRFKLH